MEPVKSRPPPIADEAPSDVVVAEPSQLKAVHVCARLRPLLANERDKGESCALLRVDPTSSQVVVYPPEIGRVQGVSRTFTFDSVIRPEASQSEVYDSLCGDRLVDKVLAGYNATIFAYGQTGSGKTFTMDGLPAADQSQEGVGLVSRVIKRLYETAQVGLLTDTLSVSVSFFQIYNERIYDLLNPVHLYSSGSGSVPFSHPGLRMRQRSRGQFYVENLFSFDCSTVDEALNYWRNGLRNKVMASHSMNEASSRSHCILRLTVERAVASKMQSGIGGADGPSAGISGQSVQTSCLTLVDLAGFERVGDTDVTGNAFKESIKINQSLFVLRRVIASLADASSPVSPSGSGVATSSDNTLVPYRESKLTAILRDSLGGNSFTAMIACLNPCDSLIEDNISTLYYAQRARCIRNDPLVNMDPKTRLVQQLRSQVETLTLRLTAAHDYIRKTTGVVDMATIEESIGSPLPRASSVSGLLGASGLSSTLSTPRGAARKRFSLPANASSISGQVSSSSLNLLNSSLQNSADRNTPPLSGRGRVVPTENRPTEQSRAKIDELEKANTELRSQVATVQDAYENLKSQLSTDKRTEADIVANIGYLLTTRTALASDIYKLQQRSASLTASATKASTAASGASGTSTGSWIASVYGVPPLKKPEFMRSGPSAGRVPVSVRRQSE